jgi:hypothetical protein
MQPPRLLSGVAVLCLALAAVAQQTPPAPPPAADYSGMYSFLKEGEFVQVTVEEQGKVTGFVSRYGDLESDRGAFLDHFFKDGKLDGRDLTFTTDTRHGVWYEFKGKVERGAGKTRADEAYYVLKGTLTEHSKDSADKETVRQREVEFKIFPAELNPEQGKKE